MSYRLKIYHKIYLEGHPELGLDRIPEGWVIHHIDYNHDNNELDNLQLMTRSDHQRLHNMGNRYWVGKKHTEKTKEKMREASTGREVSEETKRKISEANTGKRHFGYKYSDESRAKMSAAKKGKPSSKRMCTQEMVDDVNKGMTMRAFKDKYNISHSLYYKIKNGHSYL